MTQTHPVIRRSGPIYITQATHLLEDGSRKVITSRRHRKGRGAIVLPVEGAMPLKAKKYPWFNFWAPARLTWWVAILFIIGSAMFSVGGYGITFPDALPESFTADMRLEWIFFTGSLFFTAAAFCQLLESINAGTSDGLHVDEKLSNTFQWVAWNPKQIGYMASLVQLIGTVMFNFNTGSAFFSDLNWIAQNILIFTPNIIGCICFLIASRLAFMEVCHGYWGWQPKSIEWWITVLNLLGSLGFMVSALYSLAVPPGDSSVSFTWLSAFFTLQGGVCFLTASYLLLPEMFSE